MSGGSIEKEWKLFGTGYWRLLLVKLCDSMFIYDDGMNPTKKQEEIYTLQMQ